MQKDYYLDRMDIQTIKQRFGIIGHSPLLDRAIDVARQVAPTDITVLINGESGVGKEVFPQIIHNLSARKHGPYIAVNCGAIPEGTIDSELFKVGSSKVIKTDARVVAATNVDIADAIHKGKFRQDLFYRLNTVPIYLPPLRERKDDIVLLFRKFALDFAEKYRMPPLELDDVAKQILMNYRWQGNIRQLKNITEQISIIEQSRLITADIIQRYLPIEHRDLPVLYSKEKASPDFSERELLYKVLFDMKRDINDMKKLVVDIIDQGGVNHELKRDHQPIISQLYDDVENPEKQEQQGFRNITPDSIELDSYYTHEVLDESLSLEKREIELIKKAIDKHGGKRKSAAEELGISERTLYRKIKEYDIR